MQTSRLEFDGVLAGDVNVISDVTHATEEDVM